MKLYKPMKSHSVGTQFQNMSMVQKLSYHHSIFPIGFKIPLIIEHKYVKNTDYIFIYYPKCYFYMEANIHGVCLPNFKYNVLPLVHFKDNEFNTWGLYFKKHHHLTYSEQFTICCAYSNLYGCKYLISLIPNTEKLNPIYSCFIQSAKNRCMSIMKYLISVHINIDINIDIDINEALEWASKKGHTDTIRYLVSLGADIKKCDNYVVCCAAKHGHLDTVPYLVSIGADITGDNNYAICLASENGHLDTVQYLVSLGADITAHDNYAVRWASLNGHLDTVRYLVSLGADITAYNNYAIRWASENGHLDTVRYLVSQGADITACNNQAVSIVLISNGCIGIGTTLPSTRLHILSTN